jgi:hypothetical protein
MGGQGRQGNAPLAGEPTTSPVAQQDRIPGIRFPDRNSNKTRQSQSSSPRSSSTAIRTMERGAPIQMEKTGESLPDPLP